MSSKAAAAFWCNSRQQRRLSQAHIFMSMAEVHTARWNGIVEVYLSLLSTVGKSGYCRCLDQSYTMYGIRNIHTQEVKTNFELVQESKQFQIWYIKSQTQEHIPSDTVT